ncbi:MAG: hypothetical protein WCM76_14385 [Bacteroidota bacterium]
MKTDEKGNNPVRGYSLIKRILPIQLLLLVILIIPQQAGAQNGKKQPFRTDKALDTYVVVSPFEGNAVKVLWEIPEGLDVEIIELDRTVDGITYDLLASATVMELPDIAALYYPENFGYFNKIIYSTEPGHGRFMYNDKNEYSPSLVRSFKYRIRFITPDEKTYFTETTGPENMTSESAGNDKHNDHSIENTGKSHSEPEHYNEMKVNCPTVETIPSAQIPIQKDTLTAQCCLYEKTTAGVVNVATACYDIGWICNRYDVVPEAAACPSGYAWDPCCMHRCWGHPELCSCHPWNCAGFTLGSVSYVTAIIPPYATPRTGRLICPGTNTMFSVVAANPVSYQWQVSTDNNVSWSNQNDGGVYSGMNTATMNITGATAGMDNYYYRCRVTNSCQTENSEPAKLSVIWSNPTASINSLPQVCAGTSAFFNVTVSGSIPTAYQWQKNGTNIGGATAPTYFLLNPQNGDQVRCMVTVKHCPSGTTALATNTVTLSVIGSTDRYWVNGSGNWNEVSHWACSSGGVGGGSVPNSNNNVHFDAHSFLHLNESVNINSPACCKNMDWTGAAMQPNLEGFETLNIYGSLTFIGAMTNSYTGRLRFCSATTGNTITTAGQEILGILALDTVVGGWTLLDDLNISTSLIFHNYGSLNTNNRDIICSGYITNGTGTRSLTLGNSNLTITGSAFSIISTGMTFNAGTSTVIFTGAGSPAISHNGNGLAFNDVLFTNPAATGMLDNQPATGSATFNNVSFAGNGEINGANTFNGVLSFAPGKAYVLQSGKTQTLGASGQLNAIAGCEMISIVSSVAGSPATISKSAGAGVLTHYNYLRDVNASGVSFTADSCIVGSNITGWTLHPVSGLYWVPYGSPLSGTGNWTDPLHWSPCSGGPPNTVGLLPNSAINVHFDLNSFNGGGQTTTVNAAAACRNMDWSGVTNAPTLAGSAALDISGSLKLVAGITNNYTGSITFNSAITGNTIITAGNQIKGNATFSGSGSWTLQDAFNASTKTILHTSGTLITNDVAIDCGRFSDSTDQSRILNLGNSMLTISGSGNNTFYYQGGLSLNAGASTISFSGATSGILNNGNSSNAFNNVSFAGNGTINGPNAFYGNMSLSANKTYTFQSGKIQDFTGNGQIISGGSCGNNASIVSGTAGQPAFFNKDNTPLSLQWVTCKDNLATGATDFIATNAIDAGGNTGWLISSAKTTASIVASPGSSVCPGTTVLFTATPVLGGSTPNYLWKKNNGTVGGNSPNYSDAALINGDFIQCIVTSNAGCVSPVTATSNAISMVVSSGLVPAVTITASPSATICPGNTVNFSAAPANGGTAPSYQWKVNGANAGTGASFSSSSLVNNDVVTCVMTSNLSCVSTATATSNSVSITVLPVLTPSVSVSAAPAGAVCSATTVNFTATSVNGGSNPAYQWFVNSAASGNSSVFSSATLNNGDIVSCVMTSNYQCASPATTASSPISMIVNTSPTSVSAAASSYALCSTQNVTLSGAATGANSWLWNGPSGYISTTQNPVIYNVSPGHAGVYTLTTTNTCGTAQAVTAYIAVHATAPMISMVSAMPTSVCQNSSLMLTGSTIDATSFLWSGPGGYSSTAQNPVLSTVSTANAGIFTRTAFNGCGSTQSFTTPVIVHTSAPVSVIASATPTDACLGELVSFSATATDAASFLWAGPNGFSTTAQSPSITISSAAQSGLYSLSAINTCGQTTATAQLNVNIPVAQAGSDITFYGGAGVVIGGSSLGTSYSWAPINGLSIASIANPTADPLTTTTYTLTVTIGSCTATDAVTVTVSTLKIVGSISYPHYSGPNPNPYSMYEPTKVTQVLLYPHGSNTVIDAVMLQPDGTFTFSGVQPGNYDLALTTTRAFDGINSTDALYIENHGLHNPSLTRTYLIAGHTRNLNVINAIDALNCRKRYAHVISSFSNIGDWMFTVKGSTEDTLINTFDQAFGVLNRSNLFFVKVTDADVNLDINAICTGDVNGSRPAGTAKSIMIPDYKGEIAAGASQLIEVPISVNRSMSAAAISIIINIPESNAKVEQIQLALPEKYEGSDEFLYNISGGKIYISFVNTSPLELIADEPFMYLRLRTADDFATGAELKPVGNISMIEFAEADGHIVEGMNISVPTIKNYGAENNLVLGNTIVR